MPSQTELEQLAVRLVGDSSSYRKMLKDAENSTERAERSIKSSSKGIEKTAGTSFKVVGGYLRDSKGRFASVEMATEEYEEAVRALDAALKKGTITQSQYNKALDSVTKNSRTADRNLTLLGKRVTRVGKAMQSAGRTMSLALTAPIIGLGALAVREFAQFDKAMIESTSIMKVTADQIEMMRQTALDFSSSGELQQGPEALAKSYFFLASAGKDAEQSMALLPTVSKFATAGAFDMALATDLLTDAQSALGLSSKNVHQDMLNMTRVSDVLVKANTLANASVQQFSEALTNQAGASLKTYNKTVEEGVAVLAAYADQGLKGNVAGSSLSRITLLLSQSAREAAEAHKLLGFQVFDNNGKMRNYADIIENLEDITRGMSDEMKSATLAQLGFAARVQQAILPLLGTSEQIRKYEKSLKDAGGTTAEVAQKQMQSFSGQMERLKNRLSVVGIEIGQILLPFLEDMARIVKRGIDAWKELDDSTKEFILIAAGVVAALGPMLIIFGTLISSVGTIMTSVGTLGASFAGLAAGPSVALIAAMGGVVVAAAALAFTIGSLIKAQIDLNIALQKGVELHKELIALHDKRTSAIISEADALEGIEKTRFLEENIKTAEKNLKGTNKQIRQLKKELEEAGKVRLVGIDDLVLGTAGDVGGRTKVEIEAELKEKQSLAQTLNDRINKLTTIAEGGKVEIPVEVKTETKVDDTTEHIEKMKETLAELENKAKGTARETESSFDKLQIKFTEAAEAVGKTSREMDILNARDLTPGQVKHLEMLDKLATAQEKHHSLMKKGEALTKSLRSPQDKLNDKVAELDEMFNAGAISNETYNSALKQLEEQTKKDYKVDVGLKGREAALAGTVEVMDRLQEFRDQLTKRPQSRLVAKATAQKKIDSFFGDPNSAVNKAVAAKAAQGIGEAQTAIKAQAPSLPGGGNEVPNKLDVIAQLLQTQIDQEEDKTDLEDLIVSFGG